MSNLEYLYWLDTVVTLGHENGKEWRIWKKIDAMGSTIESSSSGLGFESRENFRFTYDVQGNWTSRITFRSSSTVSPPSRSGDLDIRQISYWP